MQTESYLKGSCEQCAAHIEFPPQGVGQSIACPHCQQMTRLKTHQPPAAPVPSRKRSTLLLLSLGALALLSALAFGLFSGLNNSRNNPEPQTAPGIESSPAPVLREGKPVPKPDFESNQLQAFRVAVEKPENSRLMYATGAIRNQSARQRFGVKVELELFDEQGRKIGSATDYAPIIEPQQEWKFRALVTEPKASSAKVTAITEE